MPIKKYITIFLVLIAGVIFRVEAQPSSWNYTPTNAMHNFLIPNSVSKMNMVPLQPGDAIGAFFNGKCYGYVIYPDSLLTVYGRDTMAVEGEGLTNGDTIEFKIWLKTLQCTNNWMNVAFTSGSDLFENYGYSVLSKLWGSYGGVYYSSTTFCDNQPSEAPSITVKQVSFDVLGQPVVIDSQGVVDPVNSVPGIYTIQFISETCLNNKQVQIKIGKAPKISTSESVLNVCDSVIISVTDADSITWSTGETTNSVYIDQSKVVSVIAKGMYNCELTDTVMVNVSKLNIDSLTYTVTDDQVWIDTGSVNNGFLPYKYYLNNDLNTFENLNGEFKDLESGDYTIQVKDKIGCSRTFNNYITIKILDLRNLSIDITDADCDNESKIVIDESTIFNGTYPYTYRFVAIKDTGNYNAPPIINFYSSPTIENLPVGEYQLSVTDNNNITKIYTGVIQVKRNPCSKGILVFGAAGNSTSFDSPGFYVPYNGKVRVFDRSGMLIKEFFAPGKWDGTDTHNELVPMGEYVIVHENEKPLSVTVIR